MGSAALTTQVPAVDAGTSFVSTPDRLIARWTVLTVCLVVPLTFAPWRSQVFAPLKIQILQAIIGIGLLAVGACALWCQRLSITPAPAVDLLALVFGLLNLLAYLHSRDRGSSLRGIYPEYQGIATVLTYLGAFGLARVAFTPGRRTTGPRALETLFRVLTVTTGLIGGYALAQRVGYDPLWGYTSRPFATIGLPTSMAAMLVTGLPATAATYSRAGFAGNRSRRVPGWRAVAAVAGVLGLIGLLVSLSRGGWLAALVAGGVGLLVGRPRIGRRRLLAVGICLGGVVAATLCLPGCRAGVSQAADRVVAVRDLQTGSAAKHLALARIGLGISLENPWLGVGQDVFHERAQPYADRHLPRPLADLLRPRLSESPHNALLMISAGAGVPALLAFLALLVAVVRGLVGARGYARPCVAAVLMMLTGYVVAGQFFTPEVSSTVTFWIVLGAACSAFPRATGA